MRWFDPFFVAVAGAVVMTACVPDDGGLGDDSPVAEANAVPIEANAVAIAAKPSGGFYWATLSGVIHDDDGSEVTSIEVNTEGQRGLVGLAVDSGGRLFAGFFGPDLALVVSEVEVPSGQLRPVWRGPDSVQGGNGGRILFTPDGQLILGLGLLNNRAGQADAFDVTGKLIGLDPDGQPSQVPRILSGPWNNPFAIASVPSGGATNDDIWVADNHPQDGEERLARGDAGFNPTVAAVLPPDSAPTGMTWVDDELWICAYNTRLLLRYATSANGWTLLDDAAAADCLLDVTRLADGRVAYSTGEQIKFLDPTAIN